ncbi:bifunctional tRNA (5-methylaminomethyl-2-thiouridylate)-methyltransferase MnmD/FAD-dependent cmnm(5)s(2)U34 oxidoreductase MnmC [Vibrio sp. 10N.286.49.B3]|uniref:bifunctional tRNA (5-methylaminomethyl-2-thiouridine)(34)-methyltransferase MnmD/FAD-dependent 5-carboxymethylaminomethyl-2-thiouridine(34) oxidoreductase MnmC n=1 Tax=Vibrio sp. 10N.286.49.B3 TaxID=1880855 RepID=UPI000C84F7C4|nr:bifunctional tRNA (5-methylaminomethyl-2-thiouridine)(34)-methyltransferase MnmD/FAD-dependent 5-carboxymethylaminomethyl-2-thiouridine(34) oxidoreductase MnmC [Vibrio sp. 10N.286.49.B3]PMH41832.1 bifunctional tRNA (5-methylaminomethyl-2-thiouridylate)-methyltransferase MnmD/FAD-dependent cmnm(5)s(2)U34 oxidoreductase MnmC [Vibrio sp. 10N.286.49.B3]
MTAITNAQLGWNDAGTPVSDQFDDVYFSNTNGLEETRYVFLQQNHLPQRWETFDQRRFVIGETGFGTGLNFLAVWQWFDAFRQQNPDAPLQELHFISFEKFPLSKEDLIKAHAAWPELAHYTKQLQAHYPIAVPECHRIVLADGAITLDLWFGDIKDCMPLLPTNENGLIDAWFLDGFAPSKNPEMWNQDLFNGMASLAKDACTCATFTAAGFVRRGLIDAGFEMKKVKGFGIKREMIAGVLPKRSAPNNTKPWFARREPLPAHHQSEHQDIAIIGGGIASATLAKCLHRRGIVPHVYCQDKKAAQGASGNRQGAVYPLLNHTRTGVTRVFSPGFLFARQFVDQMAQLAIPFDHDWCGVTQLMWDEKGSKKLQNILDAEFNPELIHALTPAQTNQVTGLAIEMSAALFPLGGWLCPAELTQGIFDHLASQSNAEMHYEHQVTELTWCDNEQQWQLTFANGSIAKHNTVVVANGHQFDQLLPTKDIPLSKVKGQVSHIPTTDTLSKLNTVLCYDGYMTPVNTNNQHHCIGASYDKDNIDQHFDANAQQENGDKLRQCIPEQTWPNDVDTSGQLSRQGVRSVSRDHLPFVGNVGIFEQIKAQYADLHGKPEEEVAPVPSYPNLYCFLGLGSRGLSSAPLLAEVLASQICNDPIPLPVDVLEMIHPSRMWVRRLRKGKALTE